MKISIAAVTLATAASFASGQGGTKSGKSGCTACSSDTLIRAQMVSDIVFGTFGEDGVLNRQSAIDFCCNSGEEVIVPFLAAIENTAGCLVYPVCYLQQVIPILLADNSITEGFYLTDTVNDFCTAELTGEQQPAGGCDFEADICPSNVCDGRRN